MDILYIKIQQGNYHWILYGDYQNYRGMDLYDIPSIQQTVSAIAQLYSSYIIPCAQQLYLAAPSTPNRKYTLLLLGHYNTGKSSFINHCINRPLLRTGHGKTTDKITFVLPGAIRQTLTLLQGREHFPELADLLLTEKADAVVEIYPGMRAFEPSDSAYVSQISSVFEPQKAVPASPFFFIDTPGITDSSEFSLMKQIAPKVDQILFFCDSGGFQMSQYTCDFLAFLAYKQLFSKVSVVLSKIDYLDSKFQAVQAIANCVQLIHRIVPFVDFRVFPVSMPRFLTAKTKVQTEINKVYPSFERSKLYHSLSMCDTTESESLAENYQPFLAAYFDLLAELENTLIDHLKEQFNVLLDKYSFDVRILQTQLVAYQEQAARRRSFNRALVGVRVGFGGFLLALGANVFTRRVYMPQRTNIIVVVASALAFFVSLVFPKKKVITLEKLSEMQVTICDLLMKTVQQIEKAK